MVCLFIHCPLDFIVMSLGLFLLAVKCNDDTNVLKLLAYLGAGFDCASKGEIKKVMDLGVSG